MPPDTVQRMSEKTADNRSSWPVMFDAVTAAAYMGVHENTMRAHCHAGRIPHARIGSTYRIRRADLDNMFSTPEQGA